MQFVLFTLVITLYLAMATLLVRKYLRTRDIGFGWLCAAVVGWPLLSPLIEWGQSIGVDRLRRGETSFFPFSLAQRGQLTLGQVVLYLAYARQLIGLALLFVAVFYLCKIKSGPDVQVA